MSLVNVINFININVINYITHIQNITCNYNCLQVYMSYGMFIITAKLVWYLNKFDAFLSFNSCCSAEFSCGAVFIALICLHETK